MSHKANFHIGVDLMGGESPPQDLLKAAESLAPSLPSGIQLFLIGHPRYASQTTLPFRSAEETIEMDDPPLLAIRRKRNSSLCVGLHMLKDKEIDAFVSAGNTGALVSCAKVTLSMLPGLLRPALLALMPTKKSPLAVLDVGATLDNKAVHLTQFALIGAAYQKARGLTMPSVGLLNIGSEAIKGTSELRITYQQLQHMASVPEPFFQFMGNVEGKAVFDGDIDVLITDGFTGNIFLKTAEGIASLVLDQLNESLPKDIAAQTKNSLRDFQRHLHYAEYPGALLCGVRGIVIKCHGYSSPNAFANGIREAARLVQGGFLKTLKDQLIIHRR